MIVFAFLSSDFFFHKKCFLFTDKCQTPELTYDRMQPFFYFLAFFSPLTKKTVCFGPIFIYLFW